MYHGLLPRFLRWPYQAKVMNRFDPTSSKTVFSSKGIGGSELSQEEALQIVGFRHGEQHGMIACLGALLDQREHDSCIVRGALHDVEESRFADVKGATAGDERSPRLEDLEGAEVDLLVRAERA